MTVRRSMSGDGGSGRGYWSTQQSLNDQQINAYLRNVLRDYNNRDTEAINRHIDVLRDIFEKEDDDVVRTSFGGSVSRHTYVRGLSDVDVLMIVNESSLSGQDPSSVISEMADLIRRRMPTTQVRCGDLAVTVRYSDGNEIQMLPAIRTRSGIRIAEPRRNRWSNVVHPERFAQKLTNINQANAGGVIPTIKLTKGLVDRLTQSERDRISGYHIESLAIEAFKNYPGPYELKRMISHLADFSADAVQQPIRDSTGQSRHVDDYLGPARSTQRQQASEVFRRVKSSLRHCRTTDDLDNLFD